MIRGSITAGTSGIQLLKYLIGPFARMPSKWVKTNDEQRERERHGQRSSSRRRCPTPECGATCRPRAASGTKPSMFTTQMKIIRVATNGNQRPIAFVGRPCSATWVWAIS